MGRAMSNKVNACEVALQDKVLKQSLEAATPTYFGGTLMLHAKPFVPIAAVLALSAALSACSGPEDAPAQDRPRSAEGGAFTAAPAVGVSPSMGPSAAAGSEPQPTPLPMPSPSLLPSLSPAVSSSPAKSAEKAAATVPAKTAAPPAAAEASRKALSWYYMKKKKGEVPGFPGETKQFAPDRKAVWAGAGKKVYLTFDTGGPLGESDKLLQILRDNGVKATFFLVGYNVKEHQDFTRKVAGEGHVIGNHTMTHKDLTELSDEAVKKELDDFAKLIQDVTGKPPAPLFRFPYGKYSLHLLDLVTDMGYTSCFWSTAMRDWEPRPGGADEPYNDIMNNLHDGNVILMHQGSKENIEALDKIIKAIKNEGYEFATLNELAVATP